jgi:uncharacterized protein (DUF952 family)
MPAAPIFHLTDPELWRDAVWVGRYEQSTRDAALAEVGFIHCSYLSQVEMVANFIYADWSSRLVLLQIRPEVLSAEVRAENLDGGDELFPHIYGPLPVTAVESVVQMQRRKGKWALPL